MANILRHLQLLQTTALSTIYYYYITAITLYVVQLIILSAFVHFPSKTAAFFCFASRYLLQQNGLFRIQQHALMDAI